MFFVNFLHAQNRGADSLLCHIKNGNTDRVLLYDKDCFIWIREDTSTLGMMLEITFGQFKTIGDTIYFTHPDSTRSKNKYYCYCKYKGDSHIGFHFYNVPETWPPGSIDRVYNDIFKTAAPGLNQLAFTTRFKAVKRKDRIIFLDHNDSGYLDNEYIFCGN